MMFFFLQESHGSEYLLKLHFRRFFKVFHIDFSFIDSSTGGVITFIRKSLIHNSFLLPHFAFGEGRILRSEITNGKQSMIFYNLHFYDIPNTMFSLFHKSVLRDVESAVAGNGVILLSGDFNVAKGGNPDIDHHFPLSPPVNRSNEGTQAKALNELVSSLVEIEIDEPTHYTPSTGRLSFIDRFAFFFPLGFLDILRSQPLLLLDLTLCPPYYSLTMGF